VSFPRDSPLMTPVAQWQRLRLDPALSRAWTRAGNLRLGFSIDICEMPHQTLQWLALFDGTRSSRALLESASALGLTTESALATLTALAGAGAVYQVDTLPAALGDTRISCDARATGQNANMTATEIAVARQSTRILISGAGVVSYRLVVMLEQLGFLCGWEIDSQHRISSDEVMLGGMPHAWMNSKWREHRRTISDPQLVIAIDDVIDFDYFDLKYPDALVLPIQLRTNRCEIGPLLHHKHSICTRCIVHTLQHHEPDWNLLLTQWLHHTRALPLVGEGMLSGVCATTVAVIQELVVCGVSSLARISTTLSPPAALWNSTTWSTSGATMCTCLSVLV
jgi:hypothetical protein